MRAHLQFYSIVLISLVFTGLMSGLDDLNAKTRPVAIDDNYSTGMNNILDVPAASGVLRNDIDPAGDGLTASLASPPSHGRLNLRPSGSFVYTPEPGFSGSDKFHYRAHDRTEESQLATVDINVNPVRNLPEAADDSYEVDQDQALNIPAPGVLENDYHSEGSSLSAILNENPVYGSLTLNAEGSFTYQPEAGYIGLISFTYRAFDGELYSEPAMVEITVQDIQAPDLTWVSPVADGERYDIQDGDILLEVEAYDNAAIERVNFFRWDAIQEEYLEIGEVYTAPYQLELDTGGLNLQWNQVFARAFDTNGNASDRQFIWIYRQETGYLTFFPVVVR